MVNASASSLPWKFPVIEIVPLDMVVADASITVMPESTVTGLEGPLELAVNAVVLPVVVRTGAAR